MMWLTTAANPRSSAMGIDAGVRGWKLHAVASANEGDSFKSIRFESALCGLQPRHGWGLDLFIEDKCARCASKLKEKTGA